MAWLFVRLRLRVFANSIVRGATQQQVLTSLGLVLGVLVGVGGALLFVNLHGEPSADGWVLAFVGAFAFGWLTLPLLLFGSDNTVDPIRFSLLPLRPAQLVQGQLVAGLIGGSGVFGVLTLVAAAYAVGDSFVTGMLAGAAAVLTLALCMVASRTLTTTFGGLLRSRRGRDLALVTAGLLAASIYPLQIVVQNFLLAEGSGGIERLARVVAWTPFGWPFAAVGDGRAGDWGAVALRLTGSLAVLVVLLALWARAVRRTLESPEFSGGGGRSGAGRLAPAWARPLLPAGPTGAVVAKELRYLWRDPRRRVAMLTAAFVGAGIVVAPAVSGGEVGSYFAFAGLGMAMFATSGSANQFGVDGTAVWIDVAVPGASRHVVRGRQIAVALVAVPVLVVVTVAASIIASVPFVGGAAALGTCLAAIGAGLGMTAVTSVVAPYAVPENPSNPFAGSSGAGFGSAVYQVAGLASQIALIVPIAVLVIWGFVGDRDELLWTAAVVGPVWGLGAALLGGHLGARRLAAQGPEVLLAVTPRGT